MDPLYKKFLHCACVYLCAFTNMHAATLGLTCKDALQVFSQNETLALQGQVNELKALLAHHRPPITGAGYKLIDADLLQDVCDIFDKKYPPDTRVAPVPTEDDADCPLGTRSIWSNVHYYRHNGLEMQDGLAQNSLQAIIMQVLKDALGEMSADYCCTQSNKAIESARHALIGAYDTCEWDTFSNQQLQEKIVWQAIDEHFDQMFRDLLDWDHNTPKWF